MNVISVFPAFLRHRLAAHARGWLAVGIGLLTGYYVDLYSHEPLPLVVPAAFVAAFFVVSLAVAGAAMLRFPWWFLAPLTLASMCCEWALRALLMRPWRRTPGRREWPISNPFALWQRWRRKQPHTARRRPSMPSARPLINTDGLADYITEAYEGHWKFWFINTPFFAWGWLRLVEDLGFWLAGLIAGIGRVVFSLLLVVPILAALLALVSTLLVGLGMPPEERRRRAETLARERSTQTSAATPPAGQTLPEGPTVVVVPPQRQVRWSDWLVPLAIGLWIGNAWGNDE